MTTDEYKSRFINRMTSQGVDADIAENEHAAWVESFPDVMDDEATPERDAAEAMEAWSD